MICTPNTGHLVWGYFYALDLLSQVKKLAQHSNSIFAICNSQLLPTNQICGLLSYPKKTKNPNLSPIGNRFGSFLFGGRGWITQAAHLKRPRRGLFAAGTYGGGPYELRLPIFLQPLGGALKNRSAAPASPPCFRRRRTGCGTQHPLRLACVSLAAAPTTPRCFRRWRRSSSLQSAPLLFESTLESETSVFYKTKSPAYFRTLSIFGGRGWITQAALLKTA